MTVDIDETNRAQPLQLRLKIEQFVRRILFTWPDTETAQEVFMQRVGSRRDVFQIAEHATRSQQMEYFLIQRTLPLVRNVMNGKARDHGIERAERVGQRLIEIVPDHTHRSVATETFAQFAKHAVRKIHGDRFGVRSGQLHQTQQPPAAAPEVQNPRDALGQTLESSATPSVRCGTLSARERYSRACAGVPTN